MNALLYLYVRERRAGVRRFLSSLRRPVRLLGLLLVLAFLALLLLAPRGGEGRSGATPQGPEAMALFLSMLLVFGVLGGISLGGLFFTPAELHYLVPGPFKDRSLILYRLARTWPGALLGGFFFSLLFGPGRERLLPGWAALTLFLVFSNHLQTLVGSLVARLGDSLHRQLSRLSRLLTFLLLGVLVLVVLHLLGSAGSLGVALGRLHETLPGRVLFFPAALAAEAAFGAAGAGAAAWAGLVGLVAAGALAALALPLPDLNRSVAMSQRVGAALARARRLGVAPSIPAEGSRARLRLPATALLSGAGAIVWKNLLGLLRSPRPLLVGLFVATVILVPVLYGAGGRREFGAIFIFPLLLPMISNYTGFDFRRDLENLPLLKQLPIAPWKLALAEVGVPALAGGFFLVAAVVAAAAAGRFPGQALLPALVAAPFLALLVATLDNILALWGPSRSPEKGRTTFATLAPLRIFGLLLALLPAGLVVVAALLLGLPTPVLYGSALAALTATEAAFLAWLTQLFVRADPSRVEG